MGENIMLLDRNENYIAVVSSSLITVLLASNSYVTAKMMSWYLLISPQKFGYLSVVVRPPCTAPANPALSADHSPNTEAHAKPKPAGSNLDEPCLQIISISAKQHHAQKPFWFSWKIRFSQSQRASERDFSVNVLQCTMHWKEPQHLTRGLHY